MPFQSQSQRKWMFAKKPDMAKQWAADTPDEKDLPKKKRKKQGPVKDLVMEAYKK